MLTTGIWDYIIVGGGIAGSVLSNRLHVLDTEARILVLEAGGTADGREDILYVNSTNLVQGDFDWNYYSVPQSNLNSRTIQSAAGKGLGGGFIINSCGWMRGGKNDYDDWAMQVNDSRWGYHGQLPYFKRSETFWNEDVSPEQHGHDGPLKIEVAATHNRTYPLRDKIYEAFVFLAENRRDGKRQIASKYYPLEGVAVLQNTLVGRVLLDDSSEGLVATGVRLANGTDIHGKRAIAAAGSYRTPQLLMLSGIGPRELLEKNGIKQMLELPDVGRNLTDHVFLSASWRLASEYRNTTIDSGNPLFSQPNYGLGQPNNFVASFGVEDRNGLIDAIIKDEGHHNPDPKTHPLLKVDRALMEGYVLYMNFDPTLPANASYLTTANIGLLPSSRGTITLASSDPHDPPVIDPNFFGSEVDRFIWRDSLRRMTRMMLGGNSPLNSIVEANAPPSGLLALTLESTDEELEDRIRAAAIGVYRPMGSCAMGKVVDGELRVKGVSNFHIVDASVFPVPITAHIQAAVYALAEQAAEIIASA